MSPTASGLLLRKETPIHRTVLMSRAYGVKALEPEECSRQLQEQDRLQIYYIADKVGSGFNLCTASPKWREHPRLCAMKYYGKDYKFMEYIWCRNPNIHNPDWKLRKDGIDPAVSRSARRVTKARNCWKTACWSPR